MKTQVKVYGREQQGAAVVAYCRECHEDGSTGHEFSVSLPAFKDDGKPLGKEEVSDGIGKAIKAYYLRRSPPKVDLPAVDDIPVIDL